MPDGGGVGPAPGYSGTVLFPPEDPPRAPRKSSTASPPPTCSGRPSPTRTLFSAVFRFTPQLWGRRACQFSPPINVTSRTGSSAKCMKHSCLIQPLEA